MFYFLFGVVEFYYIFSALGYFYSSWSFMSLVKLAISFLTIGLNGYVGSSGKL